MAREWTIELFEGQNNKIDKSRVSILIRGIRGLQSKSFFISVAIHLVILNIFIFRFPLSSQSFKPSFVFLGSILEQQEMGDVTQRPGPAGLTFVSAKDPTDKGVENIFYSAEKTGYRFIQATERKPVASASLGTQEKVVTKSLFDISVPQAAESVSQTAGEPIYEIVPYKPLGMFRDDPN